MFCLKCGAQNKDGAKFCTSCGSPLTEVTWTVPQPEPSGPKPAEPAPSEPTVVMPGSEPTIVMPGSESEEPVIAIPGFAPTDRVIVIPEDEPAAASEPAPAEPTTVMPTPAPTAPEPAAAPEPTVSFPPPPAPQQPAPDPTLVQPAPFPQPAPQPAPEPTVTYPSYPQPEMPPQDWSGTAPAPSGPFDEKTTKKGPSVGMIVGIVVGVIVVVVAALFATGVISFGGGSSEPPSAIEEVIGQDDAEPSADSQAPDEAPDATTDEFPDAADDPVISTISSDEIFRASAYDGATPTEVEDLMEASGLSLSGMTAFNRDDYSDSFAVFTYAGTYAGTMPLDSVDGWLEVNVYANLGSTEVTWEWDEYDSADDVLFSMYELAEDAEVTSVEICFDSSISPSDFAQASYDLMSGLDLSSLESISASSQEIADAVVEMHGLSGDAVDVETGYIGDVLFMDFEGMGGSDWYIWRECSFMGGEEFNNQTLVSIRYSNSNA